MSTDKKYPRFIVGAFILDHDGKLFLRTSPNIKNRFTCINGKVEWGDTIEQTIKRNVKEKTNLEITDLNLIGLTDGLNIDVPSSEPINMIFADYVVRVRDIAEFKSEQDRKFEWLYPAEWLAKGEDAFGPYIYDVIKKISSK